MRASGPSIAWATLSGRRMGQTFRTGEPPIRAVLGPARPCRVRGGIKVEQGVSLLQRTRWRSVDCESTDHLEATSRQFIHAMASPCASVHLVHDVCCHGDGRRACPGGMIICILNHDELY